jgi:protein-disulfide isomerase
MLRQLSCLFILSFLPTVASGQECRSMPVVKKGAVVGSYAQQTITVDMVDSAIASELCKAKLDYDKKVNELRQESLDRIVDEGLLRLEVKAKGKASIAALLKSEVEAKIKEPTEERMKAEYDRAKDQLEGVAYEEVKPRIKEFLKRNEINQGMEAYSEKLRSANSVTNSLPVYRVPVKVSGPSKGAQSAKVVILEFADFECPYCGKGNEVMGALLKKYPKDVRVIYKDFPLDFHKNAIPAAVGVRCAGKQGKYWPMHQKLFDNSDSLGGDKINEIAKSVGLDMKAFLTCIADPKHVAAVEADQAEGAEYGVEGTPAFFVNGIPLSGAQPVSAFSQIIDRELRRTK